MPKVGGLGHGGGGWIWITNLKHSLPTDDSSATDLTIDSFTKVCHLEVEMRGGR